MKARSISAAALAGIFAFSAGPVPAETMTVDGTGTGTSMAEAMPIADGLVMIKANTMYEDFESDNPDNPLRGMTGPCWGAVLVMGGEVDGGGLCQYTDADGDVAVIKWTAMGVTAEGRTTGEWEVKGGTGKWAAASGGGMFDAGTTTGSYTNMVTGEITMN